MSARRARWAGVLIVALVGGLALGDVARGASPWWRFERASSRITPVTSPAAGQVGVVEAARPKGGVQQVEPFRWGYFGAHQFPTPTSWHRGFTGEVTTWRVQR